eukprot:CAMPEP_0177631186 /NCGR_PEP_ID=MMETSP0447-20121125/1612_1 /TAXON_ID=0 /ORGANISM="Stygamoeba regulata, Strain BSH-02190019" /LENGTH=349 /DNA_ID=CAMNT_0019132647 /DNA_START=216 /DNA_END=1265 /DNA_ORIENTATION=-
MGLLFSKHKDEYRVTVTVDGHRVKTKSLIAEGGFAYVYLVRSAEKGSTAEYALKRMVAMENDRYTSAMQEVDLMASIPPHNNIVKFMGHKVLSRGPSREVLILMELCSGTIVDLINSTLPEKLQQTRILAIFADVCRAVVHLHAMSPPIAHRDLKLENVLIANGEHKLCDFGSATTVEIRPTTKQEISDCEEDIARNTTLAYRSPEMVDLHRKQLLNYKVDVWALGCLLYKLVYYDMPFDEASSLQILNCSYTLRPVDHVSQAVLDLIPIMLVANPEDRPTAQFVLDQTVMEGHAPVYPHASASFSSVQSGTLTSASTTGTGTHTMPDAPPHAFPPDEDFANFSGANFG